MESTVDQPAAQREPDPRQYAPAIDWSAYEACPSCWAQTGPCLVLGGYEAQTPHPDRALKLPDTDIRTALAADLDRMGLMPEAEVIHFDAGRVDQYAVCGFDLDRNGPDGWTTNRALVTCAACAGKLVDEQLVAPDVHLRVAIGDPIPCGSTTVRASTANPAEVTCAGCRAAAEPERRTVSVETLTDELRDVPMDYEPETGATNYVPAGARVGVIVRYADKPVQVTDVDSEWKRDKRSYTAADVLGLMLLRARFVADDHQAELLMPTPDVLAAFSGSTAGGYWTAEITMRADQLEPGWLIANYAAEGAEALIVAVDDQCEDETCPWHGTCIAVTAGGLEPLHVSTWSTFEVRIPCAVTA